MEIVMVSHSMSRMRLSTFIMKKMGAQEVEQVKNQKKKWLFPLHYKTYTRYRREKMVY